MANSTEQSLNFSDSPEEEQDPYCDKCEDDRKDKRVLGMQIVREWKSHGTGTIMDQSTAMWFEDDDFEQSERNGTKEHKF